MEGEKRGKEWANEREEGREGKGLMKGEICVYVGDKAEYDKVNG